MDMNALRVTTLRRLMGEMNQKDFADLHDLDASYLSQLLNGHRSIGERAATNLEKKIGLAAGTLLTPVRMEEEEPGRSDSPPAPVATKKVMEVLGFITIPHLNVAGSMGPGQVPEHHVEVIRDITVHLDWLRSQGLAFSAIDKLAIITGDGDSMQGTFSDGDSLLVDRGIREIRADAIYVFTLDGDIYIKRLQRMPDGALRMISDNPAYPAIIIEGATLEKIHIQARVLLVWNAKKL